MQNLFTAVLVLSSICVIESYGPPPRKTKHRTTTTTTSEPPAEPSYESNSPTSNSVYANGNPVEQPQSGPYSASGPGSQNHSPNSQPSGATYWWQGPSSPFEPQQPLPAAPSNQPAGSNPNQTGGSYPNQGSPCGSHGNQGSPTGTYACSGLPIGANPSPGSQSGPYPSQGPQSGSYPNQGLPTGSYPSQESPNAPHPGQGLPSGSYPNQGSPSGSYPNQGSQSGVHPGQGSTAPYPNQGSPSSSHPNQGSPSSSNPSQVSPSGSYPNQGSPSGTYPNQGSPATYPNQGSPSGSYPNQGASAGSYPNTPSGSHPNQGSPSGSYPNQGNPSGSQPNQGPPPSTSYPNQGQPSGSYPSQGSPSGTPYPNQGPQSGPHPNPGSPAEPSKPIDLAGNPFLSSALGINKPGCSNSFGGCANGNPQYPTPQGQPVGANPQYPTGSQGSSTYPGNGQGQPQYPGQQTQKPFETPGQPPQASYPQGRPETHSPGSPTSYKPNTPQQPQRPQYGNTNNVPGKFPPPYPGASAPAGEQCNRPGYLCVAKSACNQGVLSQSGIPGRAGICNIANEACCKIPSNPNSGTQSPQIGYGNGNTPGTNGIPIGGSIYDKPTSPPYVTPAAPIQPYTGPLNTTPHPGCSAALKCVPLTYCTAEGVMADAPVYLTREQQENRVPLTDCMNVETNVIGKCCRDPNYKDPWPGGMMMAKNPTDGGQFDDGQYHPPSDDKFDDGQYRPTNDNNQFQSPEQETSDTFSHQAGIYYNSVSTTPKGHTIKKPIGNFNQKPTPFPTKPSIPGTPGRLPAPVYENDFPGKNSAPAPSNEITPPEQGPINIGYNAPSQPNSQINPSLIPQQPSSPGSGKFPQPTYQPTFPQQPTQPDHTESTPNQQQLFNNQPTYNQPGQLNQPNNPGYPQGQNTIPVQQGIPNQQTPGFYPGQPNQPSGYQPTQSHIPSPNPNILPPNQYQPNNQNPSDSRYTVNGQPNNGQPSPQAPPGSTCGIRHKVYTNNPDEAGDSEFPWQALVTSAANKSFLCGAAIVSENAVVTAAHCVEDFRGKDLIIKAGILKLLTPTEGTEQVRPVKAIARHPQFDTGSLAKDIAVLIIAPSFNPTQHVDKICLPQTSANRPASNTCVVTGWGRQALKGPIPNSVLHKVDISFIENGKCENTLRETHLGKYFILNKGFSCAVPKTSSDLCKVDVGGPLACERQDGLYELAGVNSWDVNCSAEQTPTVFSNPDAEWIQQITHTPIEKLEAEEEAYNANKSKGESLTEVDIDQKPGFALGYGK